MERIGADPIQRTEILWSLEDSVYFVIDFFEDVLEKKSTYKYLIYPNI